MPPARRKALMNALWGEQERRGWISEKALKRISAAQGVPISRLYGVVKFYSMFRTEPQGRHVIEICGSPSCVLNDGTRMEKLLERELGTKIGGKSGDNAFSLYKSSCIGCCDEAPAMLVDGKPYTKLTAERVKGLVAKLRKK